MLDSKSIVDVTALSIKNAQEYFKNIKLTDVEKEISKVILREIEDRLEFMIDVGIEYLSLGQTYEYRIVKSAREGTTGYSGYGYIYAGIEAPLVEDRGKVVLLVESTYAAALSNELFRLEMDLAGDGWTVLRHNVWRTNTPPQIKALITADYYADPANVKSVFLFGRVPVPYSGSLCPDGHGDHCGAWAADVYYADMDGTWTDSSINSTNASRPENRNAPGDGKFDQTTPLSNFELQVGRVDMANLSSFPEGRAGVAPALPEQAPPVSSRLFQSPAPGDCG